MTIPLLTVRIRQERDVVFARQRARQIASAVGFDPTEQTRIATAVSELARNAFEYARGGVVAYGIEGSAAPQVLSITVSDSGQGIPNLDEILSGSYRSSTGLGLGLVGTRRLMDHFTISSTPAGTSVTVKKLLPRRAKLLSPREVESIARSLSTQPQQDAVSEVQEQNQELLRTLEELRRRQEEVERVNRELEDTNRGVVALYAELDERSDHLRRADELKTKFLSNMTHEFRTPVNSILALTSLLAERLGSGPDQKDEVFYVRKSAQQLSELVNDLLDIAKVEAGKIEVRPVPFEVAALFGALRGMLRPLLVNQSLNLVFEEADDLPPLLSDENKVSQILRNFISNALKYTESGEVRVSASLNAARDAVTFSVSDTGIGIPEADIARVFDEFVQIENPLQRRTKGTGLGLPLSKRLAELLGGSIAVSSRFGFGSTFSVTLPLIFRDPVSPSPIRVDPGQLPVLIIEDSDEDMLLYERALMGTRFQVVPTRSAATAMTALTAVRPAALILDIRLQGQESWDVLARFKREQATRNIPLVVISTVDDRTKAFGLGADAYLVKPIERASLLSTLDAVVTSVSPVRVLSVDDEETFRFIIREMLSGPEYEVSFASTGDECLRAVRQRPPDLILLDLGLDRASGSEVFDLLKADPSTAPIPVIIVTSQRIAEADRQRFGAGAVLPKSDLSRETLQGFLRRNLPSDEARARRAEARG